MKITDIKKMLEKSDKHPVFSIRSGGEGAACQTMKANAERRLATKALLAKSPEIISQLLKQLERCKEFIKLCDIEPEGLGDLAADCMADLEAIEEGK